jgi:hypothetical protein
MKIKNFFCNITSRHGVLDVTFLGNVKAYQRLARNIIHGTKCNAAENPAVNHGSINLHFTRKYSYETIIFTH